MEAKTIFDFSAVDLNGNEVSLSKYKGTPCLIVNFSTKDAACEKVFNILASLHKKYHNETRQDLNILLFPCFQFGASESANEIFAFFESNSNRQVGDVFAEIEVNGSKCTQLYQFLKQKKRGNCGAFINCNFTMFLTDRNGVPVERFGTNVHPYLLEDVIDQHCR
ncbi:secreted glutathione peroxidase [Culex quinquefasciatus]|uniref:Secreted glutathione peroxidase n=1 Tax=Culex quinquefasciatus TaxID=7176 RepID=B0WFH7_CULQU|nr:glutathione peroxidase [Culex quinquefasciatus]XP_038119774.1 glutathione peroxidase [Culex quinquefasciatus]XP_039430969.1 glutathione peroxidase-like [Culex pipiens pallens]EDS26245.1 secreted glutathione peroxidase [Culex quinquefasciatus]|eukprot:XP_001847461.1 secreted glutathione peroxidase [Culex quinquefasciatus]